MHSNFLVIVVSSIRVVMRTDPWSVEALRLFIGLYTLRPVRGVGDCAQTEAAQTEAVRNLAVSLTLLSLSFLLSCSLSTFALFAAAALNVESECETESASSSSSPASCPRRLDYIRLDWTSSASSSKPPRSRPLHAYTHTHSLSHVLCMPACAV